MHDLFWDAVLSVTYCKLAYELCKTLFFQIILFPPVKNRILFFTDGKNRILFVTRFEHICHSSWEICDRSRVFMYREITFFTAKNSQYLQLSHICHILLLSVFYCRYNVIKNRGLCWYCFTLLLLMYALYLAVYLLPPPDFPHDLPPTNTSIWLASCWSRANTRLFANLWYKEDYTLTMPGHV